MAHFFHFILKELALLCVICTVISQVGTFSKICTVIIMFNALLALTLSLFQPYNNRQNEEPAYLFSVFIFQLRFLFNNLLMTILTFTVLTRMIYALS